MKKHFSIALIFVITVVFPARAQSWETLNPDPGTSSLEHIFLLDSNTAWAVGESGTVVKTTDFGQTWTRQNTATLRLLHQLSFCDEMNGWIATTAGRALRTSDGGEHWEMVNIPNNPYDYSAVYCLSPDTIILAGSYRKVSRTTDGGETWTTKSLSIPETGDFWTTKILFPSREKGYLIGGLDYSGEGFIFYTQNQGETWKPLETGYDLPYLKDASFANPDTGILSTNDHYIFRTFNAGIDWEMIYLSGLFSWNGFRAVQLFSDGTGYGLAGQSVLRTEDFGDNWDTTFINSVFLRANRSLAFASKDKGFTVGGSGLVLKTTDEGDNFSPSTSGFYNGISGIYFTNAMDGWICGGSVKNYVPQKGMIGHTIDGGQSWEITDPASERKLTGIVFHDEQTGWVCGYDGILMKTEDGGNNWYDIEVPVTGIIYSISQSNNLLWFNTTEGRIFHSNDWGESWDLQYHKPAYKLPHLKFFSDTFGFSWGVREGGNENPVLIRSLNAGNEWAVCKIDNVGKVSAIEQLNDSVFLLLNYDDEIYQTIDYGLNWEFMLESPIEYAYLFEIMNENAWWIGAAHEISYSTNQGEDWETETLYYPNLTRIFSLSNGHIWLTAGNTILYQFFSWMENNQNFAKNTFIEIYPNPGNDFLNLKSSGNFESGKFQLLNSLGQEVYHVEHLNLPQTLNFSHLKPGIYFYRISANGQNQSGKWIKQN